MALNSKADQACSTAEEFTKLYYESVDRKRYLLSKYYLDTAVLSWNGHATIGKNEIQKFYQSLPSSEHTLSTLDAQPVIDIAVSGQLTFVIQTSGIVKYPVGASKPFQQNFVITAEGDKWKIVSDCFRLQEPIS